MCQAIISSDLIYTRRLFIEKSYMTTREQLFVGLVHGDQCLKQNDEFMLCSQVCPVTTDTACFCLNCCKSSRSMCRCPQSPYYLALTVNQGSRRTFACLQHQMGLFHLTCSGIGKDVQTYVTEAANPALLTDALPGLGTAAVQTPRERNTLITKSTLPTRLTPERDKRQDRGIVYF